MSFLKLSIIVFMIILFLGCAAFRGGANPSITNWPPEGAGKKMTIAVQVVGKSFINNQQQADDGDENFLKLCRNEVIKAYESSNLFSALKTDPKTADIRAEVNITDDGKANIALAFISGLSSLIIPIYMHDDCIVKTTYKNKNGDTLGSFAKLEPVTTWIELLLLPVMPFKYPESVSKDVWFDLNRNTILQAHAKGIF